MKNKTIVIYSTPTCHYCNLAKEFFKNNNLKYTEIDVLSDLDARAKMVKLSGQMSVPVIAIDNDVLVGFQQNKVEDMLSK